MFRCRWLWLLPLFVFSTPIRADELKTITGKTVNGSLESITDKDITLKTSDGPVATPLPQVLDVILHAARPAPSAEKYSEVQLFDDSLLRCTKVTFGPAGIDLELTTQAKVKVPLSAFVTMVRDAQDSDIKKQFSRLLKTKTRGDRIFVLSAGDLNSLDGILGNINEKDQTIKFKSKGAADDVDIKLERLQGISFLRTELPPEGNLCRVIDVDGNTLVAAKLAFDGKQMTVATPFGAKVVFDPTTISRLDFNFGRLTYLSDLDAKVSDTPLLGGFSPLRKDVNLNGDPIIILDKQYPKGLSMYAGTEIEFNLAGKYKQFKAVLGADARIAEEGQGKVTVSIYCDQEKRFSEVVSTKAARNITLDVKEVGSLKIVVQGTNFTNYSGHATLANAYVSQ